WVGVALAWAVVGVLEPSWLPEPLVLGPPPELLEAELPDESPFAKETNGPRSPPMAKTPATTSTTAPATARAGRSQAIAGPTQLRRRGLGMRRPLPGGRGRMAPTAPQGPRPPAAAGRARACLTGGDGASVCAGG